MVRPDCSSVPHKFAEFCSVAKKALKPDVFQNFKLIEKKIVSHNVSIYRFALPSPTHILGLPIGQHMSLAANLQVDGKSKEIMRSYTPISSDEDPGYVDLLIKSYDKGNISKHMTTLDIGDTIKIRGPKGAMVYRPGLVKRFGMIAGGTGITPMLQIIRAIVRGRPRNGGTDTTEVDLIFANVNSEDILLKDQLDELNKEDEGFRVHYVLNNPPEAWDGGVGFVTPDTIKVWNAIPITHNSLCLHDIGKTSCSCDRHEATHVRSTTHDQRDEEGDRIARLHEGTSGE